MDAFVHAAKIPTILVWAGIALGGEGLLSSAETIHLRPRLEWLLGLRILAFLFLGSAEGTVVGRLGFERSRCFRFGWSFGMDSSACPLPDPYNGEKTEEDEKRNGFAFIR
jgi:hypothetical protein